MESIKKRCTRFILASTATEYRVLDDRVHANFEYKELSSSQVPIIFEFRVVLEYEYECEYSNTAHMFDGRKQGRRYSAKLNPVG